jgi:serralysin
MAKLTFTQYAPDDYSIWDQFSNFTVSVSADKKTVTLEYASPSDGGVAEVILRGTSFSLRDGKLATGTITSINFLNNDAKTMATYSGLTLKGYQFNFDNGWQTIGKIHAGNDVITGSTRADIIDTGAGADTVKSGAGGDFITDYKGADTYDGGTGSDQLDYSQGSRDGWDPGDAVVVDLRAGTATDPWGFKDKLISIEQVRGTYFDDKIYGRDTADGDRFMGFAGDDLLDGRGGNADMVSYKRDANHGGVGDVTVDLSKGTATDGFGDKDTLKNIENIEGGFYNDNLKGSTGVNYIRGGAGDDIINGFGGGDRLEGEGGDDTLYGTNTSKDIFVFNNASDFLGNDRIKAFRDGQDKLAFDGSTGVETMADLNITQSGNHVIIEYDFGSIIVENIQVSKLTASDFIFD